MTLRCTSGRLIHHNGAVCNGARKRLNAKVTEQVVILPFSPC